MSNVFRIAVSGMNAAIAKIANAASNIANVSSTQKATTGKDEQSGAFVPRDVVSLSSSVGDHSFGVHTTSVARPPAAQEIDVTRESVDILEAKLAYEAGAKIIEAEKKKGDSLLDMLD